MMPRILSDSATRIIRSTYALGAEPVDPHKLLTDIARSASVIGDLVDRLSIEYGISRNKPARAFAFAGRFTLGLIQLSVPDTVGPYFIRNWVMLCYLVSLSILIIGFVAGEPPMWGIGVAMLVGTYLVSALWKTFRKFMTTARFPWGILVRTATYAGSALIVVGVAFAAHRWGGWIAGVLTWLAAKFRLAHEMHLSNLNQFLHHAQKVDCQTCTPSKLYPWA